LPRRQSILVLLNHLNAFASAIEIRTVVDMMHPAGQQRRVVVTKSFGLLVEVFGAPNTPIKDAKSYALDPHRNTATYSAAPKIQMPLVQA